VIVGRRQSTTSRVKSDGVRERTMTTVRVLRHTTPVVQRLVFRALNVQSANNKIDEIMDIRRDHALDVMLLSETWHDGNSVSIRRLRAEGLQVLERARPRARPASLHVNHGGDGGAWRSSSRCAYVCCVASRRTANPDLRASVCTVGGAWLSVYSAARLLTWIRRRRVAVL